MFMHACACMYVYECMYILTCMCVCLCVLISLCERGERSWWEGERRREVKQDLAMGDVEGQAGESVGETVRKEQEGEKTNMS